MTPPQFSVRSDEGDGADLRHLRFGPEDVAERVYFALRDDRWGTVPVEILERSFTETDLGFALDLRIRSSSAAHPADIAITYRAEGSQLVADFTAAALDDFTYNRIGLCVLHPLGNHLDRPVAARHRDRRVAGIFDRRIAPQLLVDGVLRPMFGSEVDGLSVQLASGSRIDWDFPDEDFEVEDQRNWSDASFKSYSTPLHLGFPRRAVAGQHFGHRVIVCVEPGATAEHPVPQMTIDFGADLGPLPSIARYDGRLSAGSWRPPSGFPELNRTRPADLGGADAIEFGLNGTVHAADDDSLLTTPATHAMIVSQARELYPSLPMLIGPIDFTDRAGEWMSEDGVGTPEPACAPADPRRHAPIAATWIVASVASAVAAGPAALRYLGPDVDDDAAGALVLRALADREGAPVRGVRAPAGVAGFAIGIDQGFELWLANTTRRGATVELGGAVVEIAPFGLLRTEVGT